MFTSTTSHFQRWWEHIQRRRTNSESCVGVATPFIPVVKMFFHPRRKVRLIYAVCCILMLICIICMFTITITNYLSHKTVFRVDQIGLTEGIQPPYITICLNEHRTDQVLARRLSIPPLVNWSILKGVDLPCQAKGEMTWSSRLHSVSTYIIGAANFNVTFDTSPPGSLSLSVTEQVPIPPDEVCTTFKLNHSCLHRNEFWKILTVRIKLEDAGRQMSGRPKVIAHEAKGFPLDNYGRYLYDHIVPGTQVHTFYSKNLQHSYTNRNRRCQVGPIEVLGQTYDYDQAACQWKKTCEYLHNECHCYCPLEILRAWGRRNKNGPKDFRTFYPEIEEHCVHSCFYEQQIMLVDTNVCPYACNTATYQKHNEVRFSNATSLDSIEVNFVQDDAITQKTEEELFGLAKLFSEVGGLSSFFFGFSCLVIFELLESCGRFWNMWVRRRFKQRRKKRKLCRLTKSLAFCRGAAYAPHCLPSTEDSPIFLCKKVHQMSPSTSALPSADCDLDVWMDIDGTVSPVSIE
uniref:Na channel amiloride sensitive n=1 Tax=Echinococcus granulosus TaxID=6210 RepID=A0A068WHG2_ECHGR|nr:Na channel amiloride sensitive [Echinococcus granulosus]